MSGLQTSERKRRGRPLGFDPATALDRAMNLFWRKGYAATSVDDLTKAMGVNRSSLYKAFGDKEALFLRCIDDYAQRITGPVLAKIDGGRAIRRDLRAFIQAANLSATDPCRPRGCFIVCSFTDMDGLGPRTVEHLRAAGREVEERLGARLAQAVATGELPADFPVIQRAALLLTMVQGMKVRARAGASAESLNGLTEAALDAALNP